MTEREQVAAIRAVRIAAHDLFNVCAAMVGGVPIAITLTYEETVGKSTRGVCPKSLEDKAPGQP